MPRSENTICAIVYPRKDLVRGTNPPTEQSTHRTTDNNIHAVYMARKHLLRTDQDATSAEDARKLGGVGCGSQVQDAPSISHMDIDLTRRFGNSVLAGALESEWTNSEPPKTEHNPDQTNICHTLCTRHGVCDSTREHRNKQKVQTTSTKVLALAKAERGDQELRVAQKHPTIAWTRIWTTLHTAWIPECLKSLWYTVIHDILSTNERLAPIIFQIPNFATSAGKRLPSNTESQTVVKEPLFGIGPAQKSPHYSASTPVIYRTTGQSAPISTFDLRKADGNSLDHRSPGGIQNAKEETFNTQRLYRLSAPSQMEGLPKISQTTQSWKLS
jgi:hypothetical protein